MVPGVTDGKEMSIYWQSRIGWDSNIVNNMETETSFVEDSLAITTKDLFRGAYIRPDITYWQEDDCVWSISVIGHDPQEITLEWEDITFGKRAYFLCVWS